MVVRIPHVQHSATRHANFFLFPPYTNILLCSSAKTTTPWSAPSPQVPNIAHGVITRLGSQRASNFGIQNESIRHLSTCHHSTHAPPYVPCFASHTSSSSDDSQPFVHLAYNSNQPYFMGISFHLATCTHFILYETTHLSVTPTYCSFSSAVITFHFNTHEFSITSRPNYFRVKVVIQIFILFCTVVPPPVSAVHVHARAHLSPSSSPSLSFPYSFPSIYPPSHPPCRALLVSILASAFLHIVLHTQSRRLATHPLSLRFLSFPKVEKRNNPHSCRHRQCHFKIHVITHRSNIIAVLYLCVVNQTVRRNGQVQESYGS